ncbi:hypothetical protein BU26DRAFT_586619 [Trematosphaeria pertusa]|uniref:Uncharacterized protein n=1 Tax=Trematosphaeria pertusa TaxID=390896 RepID=A0A6A6HSP9_9PLEO|nr:uncharacterized protein BU26DRAFT_586619 [Trematosphaeria pertusa]KAF2241027.1 hypothetical protein BU26DRAFT_586619 [Trematosphaeria pertusa]
MGTIVQCSLQSIQSLVGRRNFNNSDTMVHIEKYAAIAAALFFSTSFAADTAPKACPCYTATSFVTNNGCPAFEPTRPCIVPMCAMLTTTTIPGPNTRCPKTPVLTSFLPCQTACPTGCATFTSTEAASSSCLPSIITKSSPTAPPATTPPPSHTKPCYTKTVSATNKCPEDELDCPPPDCIYLSRTTVPGGPVEGCPVTPTVTRSRTCLGRCDGSCGTQWVTHTATAWAA